MARITPLHLIPALIAAASHAGEITIEQQPFVIEKSFSAVALPGADCTLIQLDPKAWSEFSITKITVHGGKVSKGEVLVSFDAEDIDKKIVDTRLALESGNLALQQAELDYKILQETAPNKLEALRRAAGIAAEENTYFTKTRRKSEEEAATQSLKRSEQILGNQREELRQLSKMYQADDVTEETEEIILVRQQDAVAAAQFALRMETLDHTRTLEVKLPREAKVLADAERDSAIALKKAEAEIPRSLEQGKIQLETQKTANQRAKSDLADLESDRVLFEIRASADGFFYHGPIDKGRWTPGKVAETLVLHGRPPVHAPFATFVPGSSKLNLISFLDDATARSLKPDLTGIATLAGREDVELPVKLANLASAPGPDGTYRADFSITWPKDLSPATGATAQIRMIAYQQRTAIVIPNRALTFGASGWTVEVKLADGKTESRPVKRGRVSINETEIISGLEAGQVIVVPEK
jgi:HlyD family secretion protein